MGRRQQTEAALTLDRISQRQSQWIVVHQLRPGVILQASHAWGGNLPPEPLFG